MEFSGGFSWVFVGGCLFCKMFGVLVCECLFAVPGFAESDLLFWALLKGLLGNIWDFLQRFLWFSWILPVFFGFPLLVPEVLLFFG